MGSAVSPCSRLIDEPVISMRCGVSCAHAGNGATPASTVTVAILSLVFLNIPAPGRVA